MKWISIESILRVLFSSSLLLGITVLLSCTNTLIRNRPFFVGLVAGIQKEMFEFLSQVQEKLSNIVKSVGKIDHAFWRSFHNDRKTDPAMGSIDGDLIESCLDLSRTQLKEIATGLQVWRIYITMLQLVILPAEGFFSFSLKSVIKWVIAPCVSGCSYYLTL